MDAEPADVDLADGPRGRVPGADGTPFTRHVQQYNRLVGGENLEKFQPEMCVPVFHVSFSHESSLPT